MISETEKYWSTGITLSWWARRDSWSGTVKFFDDGFADDDPEQGRLSTEGDLRTRYWVRGSDVAVVIDTLVADAQRLGIVFRSGDGSPPMLLYRLDGASSTYPPPQQWRELLHEQAQRIGWVCPYRLDGGAP